MTPERIVQIVTVARQVLEESGNHRSCIYSTELLLSVLRELGVTDARRLPVTVTAFNKSHPKYQARLGATKLIVGIGMSSRMDGATYTLGKESRDGEWHGHLVVVIPRFSGDNPAIVDLAITRLDHPESGIVLRPTCFGIDPEFLDGVGQASGIINEALLIYEACPNDHSYTQWCEQLDQNAVDVYAKDVLRRLERLRLAQSYFYPAEEKPSLPNTLPSRPAHVPRQKAAASTTSKSETAARMPPPDFMRLAAVCENKTCRTVFTAAAGLGGTATFEFPTHFAGPCPECGARGVVPAGRYVMTETSAIFTPRSEADRELFEQARSLLRAALDTEISAKDFHQLATAKMPELSWLWDMIPPRADREEFIKWATLFFVIATFCNSVFKPSQPPPPPQLALPPEIIEILKASKSSQPTPATPPAQVEGKGIPAVSTSTSQQPPAK